MKFILAALVLTASTLAQAQNNRDGGGLFVEPGLTYESGTTSTSYITGDAGGTNKGFGILGRLGFHINDVFFIAADARYSRPHFSDARVDGDADQYQVGPVVGLQTPVEGLRVWAEYVAQAQLDPSGGNVDLKFKNGTGFTVGAGFYVSVVSLNLEYQKLTYDTTEVQNVGGFALGDFNGTKAKNDSFIFSVTFPIAL